MNALTMPLTPTPNLSPEAASYMLMDENLLERRYQPLVLNVRDHLDQLVDLNQEVTQELDAKGMGHFLNARTRSEVEHIISEDRVVGVFDGDRLAASGALLKKSTSDTNMKRWATKAGANNVEDPVGYLGMAMVDQDYRRQGLQPSLVNLRLQLAVQDQVDDVFSVVSLGNEFSAKGLQRAGLSCVGQDVEVINGEIEPVDLFHIRTR